MRYYQKLLTSGTNLTAAGRELTLINNLPLFISNNSTKEFWTEERCFITEILNDEQVPKLSIAIARVEPGVTTQLHCLLGIEETYIVRKGSGIAEVNNILHELNYMDKLIIPENQTQRITNIGDEDLEFFCICTPRFVPESYLKKGL